jgi:hypothetical protein
MKIISLTLLLISSGFALACDICGGVHANSSIGLFAANRFHTLGLSSQFRSYQSFDAGHLHSTESFLLNSAQVRFQIGRRFQYYGQIPYQIGKQNLDNKSLTKQGIGDIQNFLNVILLQKKDSTGITTFFSSMALGVKVPCGKFVSPSNLQQNLYPGTGSWDYSLLFNGYKRIQKQFGIQFEMNHTWKGENKYAFRYGPSSQISTLLVYNKKIGSYRLLAATGIQADYFAANTWAWEPLDDLSQHKGHLVQVKSSLNLMTFSWLYSMQANIPVWQNINEGGLQFGPQLQLSIQYLIKQKK